MRANEFIIESERDDAIEKIRKLRNMEGRTDAERETARNLIQRLMDKYRINQEEIAQRKEERRQTKLQRDIERSQAEKNQAWRSLVAEIKRLLGMRVDETVIKLSRRDTTRSQAFVDEVHALLPINHWQPHYHSMVFDMGEEEIVVNIEVEVSRMMDNTVNIKWIGTGPLRHGAGTKAMRWLQQLATKHDVKLTLYPWTKGVVSQAALMKFYRKVGFKPTSRGNKNMIWLPPNSNK